MRNHFDEDVARAYDAEHTDEGYLSECVDFLTTLADGAPVLELAIGTGRVALPLAESGLAVSGIELSPAMVEQMRRKPGGADIPVVIGDMASATIEGRFGLVVLVFNTICNLTSQDQQTACFRNAARHLEAGGCFVIETFVPPIQKLPLGESLRAFDANADHWGIDEVDTATQAMTSHHLWVRGGEIVRRSIPFRYAWPSELDLMAQLAGMELAERWEDWERTPFSRTSERHVSVWRKS